MQVQHYIKTTRSAHHWYYETQTFGEIRDSRTPLFTLVTAVQQQINKQIH